MAELTLHKLLKEADEFLNRWNAALQKKLAEKLDREIMAEHRHQPTDEEPDQ